MKLDAKVIQATLVLSLGVANIALVNAGPKSDSSAG